MNELSQSVNRLSGAYRGDDGADELEATRGFQRAAEEWAVVSLRTFVGERLEKALAVSRAIAEYVSLDSECLDQNEVIR